MAENQLWAPWRMEWILSEKDEGCIFCDKPASTQDRDNLVLYRGKYCSIIMNLYPYNNGHLLIAPFQHERDLTRVPGVVQNEMIYLINESIKIITDLMHPDGFNIGMNLGEIAGAGIEEHLHFHVVPRWAGDTSFMPVIGHTKVHVEGLKETWDKLRPEFDKIELFRG